MKSHSCLMPSTLKNILKFLFYRGCDKIQLRSVLYLFSVQKVLNWDIKFSNNLLMDIEAGGMSIYSFDRYRMDTRKRILMKDDQAVPLTPKSFELLQLLVENRGRVLEKEAIIRKVWSGAIVEDSNLPVNISLLRKHLGESHVDHRFIVTYPGRGYSFVADVSVIDGELVPPDIQAELTPVWGAMPIGSRIYVERDIDGDFYQALARRDSLVLIKGARQVGKTSLLARGLQMARSRGSRVVITDLQNLNASNLDSIDKFFFMLADEIAEQLELKTRPGDFWDASIGASSNFERYWRKEILGRIEEPVVWGLDEVDRLFNRGYGSDVFGLFRSWHNKRALEPDGPWGRLTMAICYATEAHLFITDLNQSPFNVGTRLYLDDFTIPQIEKLNLRYGSPLKSKQEIERMFGLIGGHPYLVNRTLWEMSVRGTGLAEILGTASREDGIYGDYLNRVLLILIRDDELRGLVVKVLEGRSCDSNEAFYRLRSAGIVRGDTAREATLRCELYRQYLAERITS